ncbi:MAG: 3-hydroxy-3-methylglutaryl-CoA reductase, partial [Nitrosomonas ureae]
KFLDLAIADIKGVVKTKTSHGQLLKYETRAIDQRHVIVTFYYETGDAMGLNMINVATDAVCKYIANKYPISRYYLRSNYSSDKKVSNHNFFTGYGKSVTASVSIHNAVLKNYLGSTVNELYDFWHWSFLASQQSGMLGVNAHFANGLSAIYVATGQDVAQIVNAATGTTIMDKRGDEIVVTVKLPSLVCGTFGGGTRLPTQRECLGLMGCLGEGDARKFAEIVAATILCGEISICSALSAGIFAQAHDKKRMM